MTRTIVSRRRFIGGTAALAAGAALGAPRLVRGQDKKTVKVRIVRDIQVLDPGYMVGGSETTTLIATMPRLADLHRLENGQWTWKPSDYVSDIKQADDLNIAFTLKPGFMWSGGNGELTAEDVKFSFERMVGSDWGGRWEALDRVDVKDKYSGVIVLKKPYIPLWLVTMSSESGTVLPKAATQKATETTEGKFTTELPAQCGPYNVAEWLPKQKLVLARSPDYPGTSPDFDECHLVVIEETKSAELAFEAGELDITDLTPDTLARYRANPPANTKIVAADGPNYTWMGINTQHPKLADIRVRQAIQRAVDVDAILAAAYAGVSPRSNGIVPPGVLGHRTSSKYSFDPAKAKALLKEAGVGELSLELKTLNQQDRMSAAQIIQANLAEVGIGVELIPVESGAFWNLGQESQGKEWQNLQLWLMQYVGSPDPADHMQWFVKSQVGVWNWERWSDPEFEDLYAKGLAEADTAKREQMYLRMQEIMEDTGGYVWLTHEPLAFAHRDTIVPFIDPAGTILVSQFKLA